MRRYKLKKTWRKGNLAYRFPDGEKQTNKQKSTNKIFKKPLVLLVNSPAFIMTYDAEFYTFSKSCKLIFS